MRQCPHRDLVGCVISEQAGCYSPMCSWSPAQMSSTCQMREPNSAIPATVNGMVTLRAFLFPGNSNIFKSILVTQPYTWVFSFYLKAHASIRSLGNKMLFKSIRYYLVVKQGKEKYLKAQLVPWLLAWVLGPKFPFSDVPYLLRTMECSELMFSTCLMFFMPPKPTLVCGFSSFQEARQGY